MSQARVSDKRINEAHFSRNRAIKLNSAKLNRAELSLYVPSLFRKPSDSHSDQNSTVGAPNNNTAKISKSVEIDIEKYDELLNKRDITAEQRNEALQALWAIIIAFVELGFSVSPTEEAIKSRKSTDSRII